MQRSREARIPGPGLVGSRDLEGGFVLLVDDEPLLLRSLRRILERDGQTVFTAATVSEVEPFLKDSRLDVVLLDLVFGEVQGMDVLQNIKRERPEVEVIMMTGYATVESVVQCMRKGAFDYLAKPFDDVHRVSTTVRKAVERRRLVCRNRELEQELRGKSDESDLIGTSSAMRKLKRTIKSLAHNESHVLICGESGTGKELVAHAIHRVSQRAKRSFIPVDCGALPEGIIESELFGHERGAFTGAVGAQGLFRVADKGTLFLDEIGEIPLAIQAKLLRALQNKEVRSVGSSKTTPVDIRVISATHRDLAAMVESGSFRMDLFYRINVVRITVPPLRERREDIPLLVRHFLKRAQALGGRVEGVDDSVMEAFLRYEWPGNVRELANAIESAAAFATGSRLTLKDLPVENRVRSAPISEHLTLELSLEAYERCAIERSLLEADGDILAAARALGIGRSTFYRKLAKHRIPS